MIEMMTWNMASPDGRPLPGVLEVNVIKSSFKRLSNFINEFSNKQVSFSHAVLLIRRLPQVLFMISTLFYIQ